MKRETGVLLVLAASAACQKSASPPAANAGSPAVQRTISAAGLDSLPRLTVAEGRLVCLADGQSPCPVEVATANWLHGGRFATWEQRRQVQIWSPNQVNPQPLGEAGIGDSQYKTVVSVAAAGSGFVVIDAQGLHVLNYDDKGKLTGLRPLPPVGITRATGYAGDIPVLQLVRSSAPGGLADFEIREISAPGDTLGQTVLRVQLPWLRIANDRPSAPVPLFPSFPAYSIAPDSDIIWSMGEVFAVRRQSPAGAVRWNLTSTVPGPAIDSAEILQIRRQVEAQKDPRTKTNLDSSLAHTGKFHAAITGLLVASNGTVLVAGPQVLNREMVDLFTLDRNGRPATRFQLPRKSHVLLFAGDSLLVQRPGANAQPELRWLVLKRP